MTIDQLGSLGEFVSSIAVVASLIYLSIQVRHNSLQITENVKALRRAESNETMRNYSVLRGQMMSSDSLATLMVTARSDFDRLTEPEIARVQAYVGEQIWINYHIWTRIQEGLMDARFGTVERSI